MDIAVAAFYDSNLFMSSSLAVSSSRARNISHFYFQYTAQDLLLNSSCQVNKFGQNISGFGLRHQLLTLSTNRVNSFIPKALLVSSFYKYHICFVLYLSYIYAWNCEFLKRAGFVAHSYSHLLAHIEQCLEHRNHPVKLCRTEMSLTSFSGFSQVITKSPTTLGKQFSLNIGVKGLLQYSLVFHTFTVLWKEICSKQVGILSTLITLVNT